eukprot:TRINITY_DN30_c0_g4_i1.p1 TRINITY_DN30_c0_g4~~TRINITY_DN30_c0_g4_i1.p1  ORF type:complete len:424 (+),score=82.68 TRINITY_DN30_c0_g4_i1:182-1453(+)
MPRKKVREFTAKRILKEHISKYNISLPFKNVQVSPDNDLEYEKITHPWLLEEKLVVKPDMLFGKRGKNNLVLLNATFDQARDFIKERMGKTVEMGGLKGEITHFIVEPFVAHTDEYYLSIVAKREENTISFSTCGGIEIEENWDRVKSVGVGVDQSIDEVSIDSLLEGIEPSKKKDLSEFLRACYKVFAELNFHLLEMNPFTFDSSSHPFPLDMRAELDDCAAFLNTEKWEVDGPIEFPHPFGRKLFPEEKIIHDIDEKTGASLKLTILNPNGRIWGMIAGGGASVIYADTVQDLGFGHELGNYGEYSGDPTEEDTYRYACTLLGLATRNPDGRPRALMIGGGIANFTDVAATFSGIIRALKEYASRLQESNMKIFVRRGGPNYQMALRNMRELYLGVPIEVYGPETSMTGIVQMAIDWIGKK